MPARARCKTAPTCAAAVLVARPFAIFCSELDVIRAAVCVEVRVGAGARPVLCVSWAGRVGSVVYLSDRPAAVVGQAVVLGRRAQAASFVDARRVVDVVAAVCAERAAVKGRSGAGRVGVVARAAVAYSFCVTFFVPFGRTSGGRTGVSVSGGFGASGFGGGSCRFFGCGRFRGGWFGRCWFGSGGTFFR